MFGLFKKKQNTPVSSSNVRYRVNIDDVEDNAQLREAVKIIMLTLNNRDEGCFIIKEEVLSHFPNLSKIAKKESVDE